VEEVKGRVGRKNKNMKRGVSMERQQ